MQTGTDLNHTEAGPLNAKDTTVTPPPDLPAVPPRKALLIIGIVLLVLVVSGAIRMFSRIRAARTLAGETEREAVLVVAVIHASTESPDEQLVLPASVQAYEESPIFARTSGYLLRWNKDIGSHVNKGELLAEIDTPEIDQELLQARATRQQIAAQLEIAKISADRWQNLRKTDSVSQQEADMQASSYQQAVANLAAADANVRRLEQLESFKHVYAPFSGVITKRNVDPGALISAGSAGKPLFDLARVDPLRVSANVPQAYSQAIKVGTPAYVTLQEFPGQKFTGTVARTADAIDPATRTLVTEVDVPNKEGRLLPGSYGELHFKPAINVSKITVPINTLLFRKEGPQVALVGPGDKVQLRAITIGRDYGASLEILGGVTANDRIIINPADSIEEGQVVRVSDEASGGDQ
jgi:membrane fusion protein, multidrug efflux system